MAKTKQVYVEIDLPYCSLDFGVSPCTATGTPCFNTRNLSHDCGDTANYSATTQTVRFALNNGVEFWPFDDVPTFPILSNASSVSAQVNPAIDMGVRASCSINLDNCLSLLVGLDKSIIARDDDDFYKGTFLGKFKARNPYIFGSEVRVYRSDGESPFEVEHYTVDNWTGPDNMGGMSIKCVDFLKLTNGDSSQFPAITEGELLADIDAVVTSFTVEPVGIGDIQYPAFGKVAIGKEAMAFTRVGDVFTVTRGTLGMAAEHKQGDNVQLVGEYASQTSADIIYDLIVNYTPLDASYIDLATWQQEVNNFQSTLYSAAVVKPEPVSKLINELIEQAGLIFYADVKTKKIILKVLRPISNAVNYTEEKLIGLKQRERQRDRVSQVWTYYNQKDPFLKLDDPFNYYSVLVSPSNENLYLTESIHKVFSRWIPDFAQSVALDLNSRILERYVNPPKDFTFSLFRTEAAQLGQGVQLTHRANEDAFGNPSTANCYITSLTYGDLNNAVKAQEFQFTEYTGPGGGGNIIITVDVDTISLNLRAMYDTVYSSFSGVASITFIVLPGVYVGGLNYDTFALTVGDFGAITPKLVIDPGAVIVGAGGDGSVTGVGMDGGAAIDADYPVSIENNGTIAGGGGASGPGKARIVGSIAGSGAYSLVADPCPGLPGAGYAVGDGGTTFGLTTGQAMPGFRDRGAEESDFKDWVPTLPSGPSLDESFTILDKGGEWGTDGDAGVNGSGGSAGDAVQNNANITWVNMGTIIGDVS